MKATIYKYGMRGMPHAYAKIKIIDWKNECVMF